MILQHTQQGWFVIDGFSRPSRDTHFDGYLFDDTHTDGDFLCRIRAKNLLSCAIGGRKRELALVAGAIGGGFIPAYLAYIAWNRDLSMCHLRGWGCHEGMLIYRNTF